MKQFQEVAPPGWGHTKAEKEKTDPSKPKSKIGGTAAAMKKAQARGDIPKKLNIFALMWSMKNKGDNPHYKPGTDKKYKKYQKDESFEIDPKKFKKAKTAAKIGNLYRNTENKGEKKAAESKLKGPKLFGEKTTMTTVPLRDRKKINDRYKDLHKADPDGTIPEQLTFEGWREKAADAIKKVTKKKETPKHDYGRDVGAEARKKLDHNRRKKDHETVNFLDPDD